MAGLFETAETKRLEQSQRLGQRQIQQAPVERKSIYGAAGGALGRWVKSKWDAGRAEDAAVAERERQVGITGDADMTTSTGTMIAAKRAIEAGDQALADSLIKRGKSLGEFEAAQAKADAPTGGKAPEVTEADRMNVGNLVQGRAGQVGQEDSKITTMLAPMYTEDATPQQFAQASTFNSAVAEAANTIHHKLTGMGVGGSSVGVVSDKLLNMIEERDDILNPESGFLFWKDDGFVDTAKLHSALANYGEDMVAQFTASKTAPRDATGAPIQVAEGTTTTGEASTMQPGIPEDFDVQGSDPSAGAGSPQGVPLEAPSTLTTSQEAMKSKLDGEMSPAARNKLQKAFQKSLDKSKEKQDKVDRKADLVRMLKDTNLSAQERNKLATELSRLNR